MNRSSVRYNIYKVILENNFSHVTRRAILSEKWTDKVLGFLKSDSVKAVGKNLFNMLKDSAVQATIEKLSAELDKLKGETSKTEHSKEVVVNIIKALLQKAGIDPSDVASADPIAGDSPAAAKGSEDKDVEPAPSASGNKEQSKAADASGERPDNKRQANTSGAGTASKKPTKPAKTQVPQTSGRAYSGKIISEKLNTTNERDVSSLYNWAVSMNKLLRR